jgi:hypothetical protein
VTFWAVPWTGFQKYVPAKLLRDLWSTMSIDIISAWKKCKKGDSFEL